MTQTPDYLGAIVLTLAMILGPLAIQYLVA